MVVHDARLDLPETAVPPGTEVDVLVSPTEPFRVEHLVVREPRAPFVILAVEAGHRVLAETPIPAWKTWLRLALDSVVVFPNQPIRVRVLNEWMSPQIFSAHLLGRAA
jgi:hypothetical protein